MPLSDIYFLNYSAKKQLSLNKIFAVLCANSILISCGNEADVTLRNVSQINGKIINPMLMSFLKQTNKQTNFPILYSSY